MTPLYAAQNAAPRSEGTQEQAPPPVAGPAPSRPAEAAALEPVAWLIEFSNRMGEPSRAVHLYNAVGDYREQLDSDATSTPLYARPEAGTLFRRGEFTLHSGKVSDFKIDCDALTATDLDTLAAMIVKAVLEPFGSVEGVPTGGLRLAKALEKYATSGPLLIVDDVLTTGGSMKAHRGKRDAIGAVIFARGRCPIWVRPLFTMSQVPVPAASAWGWIRPDGSFVVDSQMEDEAHCWQIGLGWPDARREIEEAKRKGWKVCRFLVAPIQNAAPPELPAVTSASRPDDQIVSASKEDCQGSAKGVRDSAKYPAAAAPITQNAEPQDSPIQYKRPLSPAELTGGNEPAAAAPQDGK